MKLIVRYKDIILDSPDMEELHTLNSYPVFMGCVDHDPINDLRAEQTWEICRSSGILQLKKLIPLDILYGDHHSSGAVGETWMDHHQKFAEFILEYKPKKVLEIGGAHGILAKKVMDTLEIPWTIIEPNPNPVKGCKATFIKGFIKKDYFLNLREDTIIHSHVLEHLYDPLEFFKNLSSVKLSTKLIFSVPNMFEMLKRKYTNCLNFEHTLFITEPLIDYLLSISGFAVLKKKYYKDDHSIFYSCIKKDKSKVKTLPKNFYSDNKKVFLEYIDYHRELVVQLNNKIEKCESKVFLFGAHVFSQYLLEFGLKSKNIECILDNDINKQGKRLYGTNLNVNSPKMLKEINNPCVILKAGAYNQEIKEDIIQNINPHTKFI